MLELVCRPQDIACALNDFNSSYHADFARVRQLSKHYLAEKPNQDLRHALSESLRVALTNWGAGRRKAPGLATSAQIAIALADETLHERLMDLSGTGLQTLGLSQGCRIGRSPFRFTDLDEFDAQLLDTLGTLSDRLFIGSTNVTYPMKALLLLTGIMPALDSQVRKGMTRAGMPGLSGTRVLLPRSPHTSMGRRLCQLPFLLGHCWETQNALFMTGIAGSDHPELNAEPGRVFDILFFMQQEAQRVPLLSFRWA